MKLRVYLIKPSLYDEDGYVVRFRRGVLPSNTLGCLNGLLHGLPDQIPGLVVSTRLLDETVDRVEPRELARDADRFDGLSLFFLCGIQTNQLPRAGDIAREASGHAVARDFGKHAWRWCDDR